MRERISRRTVLAAGTAALGVAGFAAATATGLTPLGESLRSVGLTIDAPQLGYTRVERVYSAKRNRTVDLVFLLPARNPPAGLPMSLMLHGLHGTARSAAPSGLVRELATGVARNSVPAYGYVAVDGGDNYWHEVRPGDDPMAMLLEEVPRWLAARNLAGPRGLPFAVAGVSMGGFGALVYGRRRVERRQPPEAVAAVSPALITSWTEMAKRHIFTGRTDWTSLDPLRHLAALRGVPTALWCGTEDSFITGVRRYIAATHPAVGYTAKGMHSDTFFHSVVPNLVSFVGKHVPRTA
ncbi:MAG TPA: alpha/beta hydrolase-fold protein [Amycolatopsis sp.]|nr:alpha/beta hydrolase-fold protein [Amycolatopsis sp.]